PHPGEGGHAPRLSPPCPPAPAHRLKSFERRHAMRHRKSGRPLGRNSAHRKAMYRNMVTSLLEHERITTTEAKAKELRRFAERTITRGLSIQELLSKPEADRTPADKARIVHAYRMAGRLVRS